MTMKSHSNALRADSVGGVLLLVLSAHLFGAAQSAAPVVAPSTASGAFKVSLQGWTGELEFVPFTAADGSTKFVSTIEIPWDLFDVFVFALDDKFATDASKAVTKPTKPYVAADRGFGHKGFPAISLSHKAATQCAAWIAAKASIDARLPTDAEWKLICAQAKIPADAIEEFAWTNENSPDTTHKCGKKTADALGCFDLYGNAGEWVNDAKNPRMMGGSFQDARTAVGCASELTPSEDWNSSDPQFPKSIWWLADGPFCGFRVVSDSVPVKGT